MKKMLMLGLIIFGFSGVAAAEGSWSKVAPSQTVWGDLAQVNEAAGVPRTNSQNGTYPPAYDPGNGGSGQVCGRKSYLTSYITPACVATLVCAFVGGEACGGGCGALAVWTCGWITKCDQIVHHTKTTCDSSPNAWGVCTNYTNCTTENFD